MSGRTGRLQSRITFISVSIMNRTRIKICGLTRKEDIKTAVSAGADALGFVFYPKSPRYVSAHKVAELTAEIPPFVTTVGLFVNADIDDIRAVVETTHLSLLQFHGDETPEWCAEAAAVTNRPFIRVFRVKPDTTADDLLQYERIYRNASPCFKGLLLDTWTDAYGGAGKVFNWSLVSKEIGPRVVLSGGLSAQNVAGAVSELCPFAVDVSSGVEAEKGIKDVEKIQAFIRAVRQADESI